MCRYPCGLPASLLFLMRILLLTPPLFLMACDLQVRDRAVCPDCGVVDGWNEDGVLSRKVTT